MDQDVVNEIERHIDVVNEERRSQIAAVLEGLTRLVERADEHDRVVELETGMDGLRTRMERVESRLTS